MKTNYFCPLRLVDKLEARCDSILQNYASAELYTDRDVYRQHHEALSNFNSITAMRNDCAAYLASHPTYPIISYLGEQS